MSNSKIVFFEIEAWQKKYFKNRLQNNQSFFAAEKLTSSTALVFAKAEIISTFIYSILNKDTLRQLPRLKFISTRSTGFDHIDLSYCRRKNILVSNVPDYGQNTVAEHTFALILALSRKIAPSLERTKRMEFSLEGLRGFDLLGRTIGIVGLGHIGQFVAKIAQGLGMKILVLTPHADERLAKKYAFRYVDNLKMLLSQSDIVSLHCPLNQQTRHLINEKNIDYFKKGSLLINTARGGLIETKALIKALDKDIIAGAGLDVLEEEEFIKEEAELLSSHYLKKSALTNILRNHLLLKRDNVIITPHNAFNSKEAVERILQTTGDNIQGFINGRVKNLVD